MYFLKKFPYYFLGFLVAQVVKNLPAMQETLVRFLGWEDPLEKGWVTHSSILGAFPVVQSVKNLSVMQEPWVLSRVGKLPWRSLAPSPVFLPGESPRTGGRLQSVGSQRVEHD